MEICYLHDVVSIYGCIISTYVTSNDEYSSHIRNTPFHSACIPPLSIKEFMERIYKYFNCSSECYLLSLIYIDRLIRLDSFVINGYSVYRVVLTSLMMAAKFFDDVYFTNAFYADVGGITVEELNTLEVDFLCRIRFNLYVTPQDYQRYYLDICDHCSTLCRNCSSIRLPSMINCTPYEETPLLRFQYRTLSPYASMSSYASNYYSNVMDYQTSGMSMSYYSNNGMMMNSTSGYPSYAKYYSNSQQFFPFTTQPAMNTTIAYNRAADYSIQMGYSSNQGYGGASGSYESVKEKSYY